MLEKWEDLNWTEYYQRMYGHPPHEPLLKAIGFFNKEGFDKPDRYAIDLGCGSGNDSLELLRLGWNVLAIDREEEALAWLKSGVSTEQEPRLITMNADFNNVLLPEAIFINAGYSLPFCDPNVFSNLWQKITKAILPKGRFSGHFFGMNDGYAKNRNITVHSKENIEAIFEEFTIEFFDERDQLGVTIGGIEKHWHVFSIVAKKK